MIEGGSQYTEKQKYIYNNNSYGMAEAPKHARCRQQFS